MSDARTLKRGRLRQIHALMHSLRFHRPAIAMVVGEPDSQRLATYAGKIIEVIERTPAALDPLLRVEAGAAGPVPQARDGSKLATAQGLRHGADRPDARRPATRGVGSVCEYPRPAAGTGRIGGDA